MQVAQHLVGVALPPVVRGEDLHFVRAAIAGSLHPGANQRHVDHAVAHHAAIEQQIGRRHQPVADVERQQAVRVAARALDFAFEVRVPPDVVDVDGDADARAQFVAQIVGMRHRVDAGAVGRVHRVQRLDRQRHAGGTRVFEQFADAVAHHFARAGEVLRRDRAVTVLGQPADDQHEARRAERPAPRRPRACCRRAPHGGPARSSAGNMPPRQ